MTEYQLTFWRDLPSLVVARDGDDVTKSPLAPRFQEAIDEAAMRLGDTSSDDYLSGWTRGEWTPAAGSTTDVCDQVSPNWRSSGQPSAWPSTWTSWDRGLSRRMTSGTPVRGWYDSRCPARVTGRSHPETGILGPCRGAPRTTTEIKPRLA